MKKHTIVICSVALAMVACSQVNSRKANQEKAVSQSIWKSHSASYINRAIEKNHYQNLLNAFNRNDASAFSVALRKMKLQHAKGSFIDDAYYLSGMWHFSKKEYGPALKEFHTVVDKYPKSNGAPGAMYAKGVVLQRMNLPQQAKSIFQLVKRHYPNSKESWRAQAELNTFR